MLQSDDNAVPELTLLIDHFIDSQVSIIRTGHNDCELPIVRIS